MKGKLKTLQNIEKREIQIYQSWFCAMFDRIRPVCQMFVKCSSPHTTHLTNSSSQAALTPLPISQRDHNSQYPIINIQYTLVTKYHNLRELFNGRQGAQEMENNLPVGTRVLNR